VHGEEEIWIHKMFFTTEDTFPTVLRRSEVVDIQEVEISPLENALTDLDTKTKELTALNVKYTALAKTSQVVSTNPLARVLNTVVDAPADSGIASYRNTFFAPDYLVRFPERAEQVEKLRLALDEHVSAPICISRAKFTLSIGSCDRQLLKIAWTSLFTGVYTLPRNPD
jgi:dedicator of cytokinesis protein 3